VLIFIIVRYSVYLSEHTKKVALAFFSYISLVLAFSASTVSLTERFQSLLTVKVRIQIMVDFIQIMVDFTSIVGEIR